MKFKNLLFSKLYVCVLVVILLGIVSCKPESKYSIYETNFDRYIETFFVDVELNKTCHQFILFPEVGCGFCLSVTEKFINSKELSNLMVFTNKNIISKNNKVFKEMDNQESILSNINLKTQKGPSIIQFKDQNIVYIEAIDSDNYKEVFNKIENFSKQCN